VATVAVLAVAAVAIVATSVLIAAASVAAIVAISSTVRVVAAATGVVVAAARLTGISGDDGYRGTADQQKTDDSAGSRREANTRSGHVPPLTNWDYATSSF
jgi:hypothetical protein